MSSSFKPTYDPAFFERLCPVLESCIPGFDKRHFIFRVFNNRWPDMSHQQRVIHIAKVLRDFLPGDFSQAASYITAIARRVKTVGKGDRGIDFGFLLKYVELFGTEHVAESTNCLNSMPRQRDKGYYRLHATAVGEC